MECTSYIMDIVLFAWLISRTFSANEQYFSLTTNQSTVLSAMSYQPSEQGKCQNPSNTKFSISFTLCFCYNNESISLTCANSAFTILHTLEFGYQRAIHS